MQLLFLDDVALPFSLIGVVLSDIGWHEKYANNSSNAGRSYICQSL